MLIRVIDFETTGFPPNAGVVEAGWTDVIIDVDGDIRISETTSRLCNPNMPIQPQAEAVHGITDAMIADAPAVTTVFMEMVDGADAFCAHNAEFEQNFFGGGEKPWICTYKVALSRRPGLSSYKCGNLPGLLGIGLDADRCAPLHRAGPDTYVTARILQHFLLSGLMASDLVSISGKAKEIHAMPFGKHRGTAITALPDSYIAWAVENMSAVDVKAALIRERDRRRVGGK